MMKKLFFLFIGLLVLVCSVELLLRAIGLGSWIVYESHPKYEYFQLPNQQFKRFGNSYSTNSLGMRGSREPTSTGIQILKFGDSVLNGGSKLSDKENVSNLISDSLTSLGIENTVLNISAGSWGVENAFRYFQNKNLRTDIIVLVFSSHDFTDNMHFKNVVGTHPNWPNREPICAIDDLWSKWLKYKLGSFIGVDFQELNYLNGVVDTSQSPGWEQFNSYCSINDIPLLVYLHPEQSELASKSWSQPGDKLIAWLEKNKINYISGLQMGYLNRCYADNIHLNAEGHRSIAANIFPSLLEIIEQKK